MPFEMFDNAALSTVLGVLLTPWGLAVLGLCVGSFLNVVIHRLPLMLDAQWKQDAAFTLGQEVAEPDAPQRLTLSTPASRCPACGHQIRWFENIPLVSWLVLRGKCSACGTRISVRYPLVELLTAGLFAWCGVRFGAQPTTLLWCGFVAALIALAMIDWDTTLLPDDLTLPLLWAGLLVAALGWNLPLKESFWGAVTGYLSLWSVYWLFKLTTGKEGMGYGDFKLLAAIGAWLGWKMLQVVIMLSSFVGAIVGIGLIVFARHDKTHPIPFGPYLVLGGLIAMFRGDALIKYYLQSF